MTRVEELIERHTGSEIVHKAAKGTEKERARFLTALYTLFQLKEEHPLDGEKVYVPHSKAVEALKFLAMNVDKDPDYTGLLADLLELNVLKDVHLYILSHFLRQKETGALENKSTSPGEFYDRLLTMAARHSHFRRLVGQLVTKLSKPPSIDEKTKRALAERYKITPDLKSFEYMPVTIIMRLTRGNLPPEKRETVMEGMAKVLEEYPEVGSYLARETAEPFIREILVESLGGSKPASKLIKALRKNEHVKKRFPFL